MPRDFETLLEWSRANPGAFALTSPKNGGSGEGFLIGVANHFMDDACRRAFYDDAMSAVEALRWVNNSACLDTTWDYLRALYPLAAITNGNAATQNLIANHGATIGTVWEDLTFVFVKRKLQEPTVRLSMPESGMPASADALFVVAGAAHPAAALLLIDFALSKPIQEWKLQQMGSRSPRDDIDEEGLPGQPSRNLLSVAQRRAVPRWPSSPVVAALDNAFVKQVVEADSSK
jgi:multiple sugar transport system substrate-binding protein/putative spermidine/putrescine transport system substrate-binding protein